MSESESVHGDRWLELDLYWFRRTEIEGSAREFLARYSPFFRGASGLKGVILNPGWLIDYIAEWSGNLGQRLPLQKEMKHWVRAEISGPLLGTNKEREQQWRERFASGEPIARIEYEPWTYRELGELANAIRAEARRRNLGRVLVGTLTLGWFRAYDGEGSVFGTRHPEVFIDEQLFNQFAALTADPVSYAAYPNGIPAGTPIQEFLAMQWGDLSKSVGLDAIVLRDGMIGSACYVRRGPYGRRAPEDPVVATRWSARTAAMIRRMKEENPDALVVGYSYGASATGEWRTNLVDIEAIAKEGYLDVYIDQTWGGAWNEVGYTPHHLWGFAHVGYTFQHAYMLLHQAMLAGSRVRHYGLINTWDAWESFAPMLGSRERLRWEIWAYSHAAAKMPDGLSFPRGAYVSWCNRGHDLIPEHLVHWLSSEINEAFAHAGRVHGIPGPTLVYNRSALQWMASENPQGEIKEWIDEQAACVSKWSLPIGAIARLDALPHDPPDLTIFQTPVHLSDDQERTIRELIRSGRAVAIFADPANGVDRTIASDLGLYEHSGESGELATTGTLSPRAAELGTDLSKSFRLFHVKTGSARSTDLTDVYSVDGIPRLLSSTDRGRNVSIWDPPDRALNTLPEDPALLHLPTGTDLGSPVPFVLASRVLNAQLAAAGAIHVEEIDPDRPIHLLLWQMSDGSYDILVAQLEEGVASTTEGISRIKLFVPDAESATDRWSEQELRVEGARIIVELTYGQTRLLNVRVRKPLR